MSKDDLIEIFEVDNPEYVAYNDQFKAMVGKFAQQIDIPCIKPETLFLYLNSVVDGIFRAKLAGMHPDLIDHRLIIGLKNKVLNGFTMFHRMPEGMPYLRTMSWPYLYAEDIRLTQVFCRKVIEYKKKWRMKYISGVAADPRLARLAKKCFKTTKGRSPVIGPYLIFTDIWDYGNLLDKEVPTEKAGA